MKEHTPDQDVHQSESMAKLHEKLEAIAVMEGVEVSEIITRAIINYAYFWDAHASTETKLAVVDRKTNKLKYDIGRI